MALAGNAPTRGEFSSYEFATLEFALAYPDIGTEGRFAMRGTSQADARGQAKAGGFFSGTGAAEVLPVGQAQVNVQLDSGGSSASQVVGTAMAWAQAQATASSTWLAVAQPYAMGAYEGSGAVQSDWVGLATASAGFVAPGASQALLAAQAYALGQFIAPGAALVSLKFQEIHDVSLSAPGIAQVNALGGEARYAVWVAPGSSEAQFAYLQLPGFDIVATSTGAFASEVTASLTFAIEGIASSEVLATAPSWAQVDIEGVAEVDALAQPYSVSAYSVLSVAEVLAKARSTHLSAATMLGTSAVDLRARPYAMGRMQAPSQALVDFSSWWLEFQDSRYQGESLGQLDALSAYKRAGNGEFSAPGESQAFLRLVGVNQTAYAAASAARVIWWRGRNVLPFMMAAFDVVEHPEELRAVERAEELRTIERVEEIRAIERPDEQRTAEYI